MTSLDPGRRRLLERALFGAGYAGLRALATGLPIAAFTRPLRALGASCDEPRAKFLIYNTSSAGDPQNANVPGTYVPGVVHAAAREMAATEFRLGREVVKAAQIWSTLPQWVLDRTCFFHHATLTNSHANHHKVLKLMGNMARQEMLPSFLAKELAPCLGTVQVEPVSVGAGSVLSFEGRSLPNVPPRALRDVLARPHGPLEGIQKLRDRALDRMYAAIKASGTREQRAFVDRLALSRGQARSLSDDLLEALESIQSDAPSEQIKAALVLVQMKVAPVLAIRLDFGGDNHSDSHLAREVAGHVQSIGLIRDLMESLRARGLEDQVVFASQQVFGRTLKKLGTTGRDHWASHHCSIFIGKSVAAGVVGGVEPRGDDFWATPITSSSGRAAPGGGDIGLDETLAAAAKTLGRAVGVAQPALDENIRGGKTVAAALAR